jgi:hypothetical protein
MRSLDTTRSSVKSNYPSCTNEDHRPERRSLETPRENEAPNSFLRFKTQVYSHTVVDNQLTIFHRNRSIRLTFTGTFPFKYLLYRSVSFSLVKTPTSTGPHQPRNPYPPRQSGSHLIHKISPYSLLDLSRQILMQASCTTQ